MSKFFNAPMTYFVMGLFTVIAVIQHDFPVSVENQNTFLFLWQFFIAFWYGFLAKIAGPLLMGIGIRGLVTEAIKQAKESVPFP